MKLTEYLKHLERVFHGTAMVRQERDPMKPERSRSYNERARVNVTCPTCGTAVSLVVSEVRVGQKECPFCHSSLDDGLIAGGKLTQPFYDGKFKGNVKEIFPKWLSRKRFEEK